MIDIHSHILFGVDDGAKDLNESLALIEHQMKKGYTEIYLTPHLISGSKQCADKSLIYQNFQILLDTVKEKNYPITLHLGSEIYYVDKLLERIHKGEFIALGDTPRYLVEFSTKKKTLNLEEVVYHAGLDNIIIIIAHPERYTEVDIEELHLLRKMGARLQINQGSLEGEQGGRIKRRAKRLLKLGLVDYIASDIHHLQKQS